MNMYNIDPNQQQPPNQLGYTLTIANPQAQQQQAPQEMYQMTPQQVQDCHAVRMRQSHAQARQMETSTLLSLMREVRSAIDADSIQIGEDDRGATTRPPLTAAFNDLNRVRLQGAYLRLTERCANYVDNMIGKELGMPLTNEIKKSDGVRE